MNHATFIVALAISALSINANAKTDSPEHVPDELIAMQRSNLDKNTQENGFGPQSPRDINSAAGNNQVLFATAPDYKQMNLCNIHFHKNAEHSGGEFSTFAGNGDGYGIGTGYVYSGKLSQSELAAIDYEACPSKQGGLHPGDTVELHYVHSSAQVKPGPTLGACLSEAVKNPQLRVEAQVFVLVNDSTAEDFTELAHHSLVNGFHQAENIPDDTGIPTVYLGSTTGPGYNETGSPFQVTWSVRPNVAKVDIATVNQWCESNAFDESHAHGVRNLVSNPDLLSPIE